MRRAVLLLTLVLVLSSTAHGGLLFGRRWQCRSISMCCPELCPRRCCVAFDSARSCPAEPSGGELQPCLESPCLPEGTTGDEQLAELADSTPEPLEEAKPEGLAFVGLPVFAEMSPPSAVPGIGIGLGSISGPTEKSLWGGGGGWGGGGWGGGGGRTRDTNGGNGGGGSGGGGGNGTDTDQGDHGGGGGGPAVPEPPTALLLGGLLAGLAALRLRARAARGYS